MISNRLMDPVGGNVLVHYIPYNKKGSCDVIDTLYVGKCGFEIKSIRNIHAQT